MTSKHDRAILNSVFNPLLPLGECPIEEIVPENLRDEEEEAASSPEAKNLELKAVQTAERGDVDSAIEMLSKSIQLAPRKPSLYNNRAQAYRLKGDVTAALQDLNNSINLSEGKGRSGCLAYCQRALIYRLQNKQEKAVDDFKKAAALGSAFANAQLVQMNPYAALCNQMLSKVFQQYKQGAPQQM